MTNTIPSVGTTLSSPDRSLSLQISPTLLQRIYSLFLWDLNTNSVPSAPEMDASRTKTSAEYFFTVPPQVHEMDETFSTVITPTQDGSKFTESYGSIIKNIRLTGTTGVRPYKLSTQAQLDSDVANDAARSTAANLGQQNRVPVTRTAARGLSPSEITGHDSVITLRNLFRLYSDYQQTGNTNIVMVWRNIKDDDYWIVEPQQFKLNQTSKSPFSYSYTIALKTLTRFDRSLAAVSSDDPQDNIRGDVGFSARMQSNMQTMMTTYYSALANGDLLRSATDVTNITAGINQMVAISQRIATGGLVPAETIVSNAIRLKESLEGGLAKLVSTPGVVSKRVQRLSRDFRRLRITCDSILTERRFRNAANLYTLRRARITNAYTQPTPLAPGSNSLPNTGGSPSFLGNTPITTNVGQGVVQSNDDIRMIAQRLLGDPRRWQELVVLNNIKPPYISPDGANNTLKPGDAVIFPKVTASNPQTMIGVQVGSNQEYDNAYFTDSTLFLDQTYGRDILLSSNESAGSFDLTDMAINQRGDIATVSGIDNVEQAINIKFATEQGELKQHPFFGARYNIGSKATLSSFNEFRVNTLSTFLSDGRIEEVLSLNFQAQGDILFVGAQVKLVNGDDYINTSFALRRF